MELRLNWLIIGAGAIGTYIGGSLILHGQKVAFLELTDSAAEIADHGLRLNIQGQEHRILHPDIFPTIPEALTHLNYDIAVFCLKSYDTKSVLDLIAPYATRFPPILCLQNGIDNETSIASIVGEQNVIAGTVTSSVRRRAVGDILLERARGIGIAAFHPLSSSIQSILSQSGMNARLFQSPASMKWSKMLTNLLANASSAILDMTPAEILRHQGLYSIEITQLCEAIRVCKVQKIKLIDLPGTPVRIFAWLVYNLIPQLSKILITPFAGQGRGQKMPSFHIDLHSNRGKSEVDYLNGAVVRFGKRMNIPTPVNAWLNQTLGDLTQGNLPLDNYSHQPAKYIEEISSFSLDYR